MGFLQQGIFTQPSENVFHIDDCVINNHADGDGEAAQRHGVHTDVESEEDKHGDGKGHRHRHEGDEGGAKIQQEKKQNDRHHDRTVANGFHEVTDGVVDEVLLLEQ